MNALTPAPLEGEILRHEDIRVVATLKPFQQARIERWYPSGITIAEIVARIAAEDDMSPLGKSFSVTIDGHLITAQHWHRIRPKPETTVVVHPVAEAFIAPIFAAVSAGFSSIFSGFFGNLLLAGLGIGLKLLVGLLFPPPKPEIQKKPKEAYNFAGARNQAAPFEPIPVVLGKHRVTPFYGGLPYTEDVGDDQFLRALFVVGYGPLDITSIRIGETPITEFDDVDYEVKEGYVSDTDQTLYPKQVIEEILNVTLEGPPHNDPSNFNRVTRYTASNISEIGVNFFYPQGLIRYNSKGSKVARTSTIKIRYRAYPGGGSWTNRPDIVTTRKTPNPIRVGTKWAVTNGPQYEVEIYRETIEQDPDATVTTYQTVNWGSLKGFRPGEPITFNKPLALIAMRIRATSQLSGTLDTVNCIAHSKCKSWNPSLSPPQWVNDTATNYPHDLFRHVLQGPANARPVADSKLDLTQLEAWGTYCRQQGFRYNKPVSEARSVFDTLQEIAAAGRAVVVFKDGKWSVAYDEQSTPTIQVFTPRNSRDFTATHDYVDLPHAWRVEFVNELKRYVQDERIVYDDGYAATAGGGNQAATKFQGLDLPGITHPDLVWKHARFHLAQLRLRPETYEITVDFENLKVTRGDRVRVNHDVMLVGVGAGRVQEVISSSPQGVVMDETFVLDVASTYQMRFRLADGTYALRDVVAGTGGQVTTLMFSDAGTLPSVGDLGWIGLTDEVDGVYRVLSITQLENMEARLTLVDEAAAIYDADTGTIPAFDSNVTEPVDPFTFPPTQLTLQQSSYQAGSIVFGSVRMSWLAPPYGNVVGYDTQWYDDGVWYNGPSVPGDQLFAEITGLNADTYQFRVRARFASNGPAADVSSWLTSEDFDMSFLNDPPPSVDNFRISTVDAIATLTWDPVTEQVVTYEIRFVPDSVVSPTWNGATPLITGIVGTAVQLGAMVGTYMIKAVNQQQVKSLDATEVYTNISEIAGLNVVELQSEHTTSPPFAGVKEDTTNTGGILKLANISASPDVYGVEPEGIYYFDGPIDLGEVFTSRITPVIEVSGEDVTNVMSEWATLASVTALDTSSQSSWSVEPEIRISQDGSPSFGDWLPLTIGDYTGRIFDFRLKLFGMKADDDDEFATVTPAVTALSVQIDMPDRVEAGDDILTSVGSPPTSHRVDFAPPFRVLAGLSIAVQDMASTDRYAITAKSEAGFNIQFFNTSTSPETPVARTFDYVAKGYGRQLS
jgi:hypothetical protein